MIESLIQVPWLSIPKSVRENVLDGDGVREDKRVRGGEQGDKGDDIGVAPIAEDCGSKRSTRT